MALVGYARVSTPDQNPDGQVDQLRAAGCDMVFVEHASGATSRRPVLSEALAYCRSGDTLTVVRLDRLARSVRHLLDLSAELDARDIGLRSLTEQIDTASPGGRLVFVVLGAVAELGRALIVENTMQGLASARARGRKGGRRPTVTPEKLARARQLLDAGSTADEAARAVGVGRSTLYRALSA